MFSRAQTKAPTVDVFYMTINKTIRAVVVPAVKAMQPIPETIYEEASRLVTQELAMEYQKFDSSISDIKLELARCIDAINGFTPSKELSSILMEKPY